MTRMTSARVVGVASLFYMAVGVANEVLTSRSTSGQGTTAELTRIALYATEMRITIILKLCECFAAVVLAVAFYGITREEDHELAILGLVCRAGEGVFVASLVPNAQALLWLAGAWPGVGAPDIATTNALAVFLLRPGGAIGAILFAVGSLIFSYLLLRGRMVPVSLAWWGVLSSALLVIGLPFQLAGFFTGPLTAYQWVPTTVLTPVLALWLLIKGVATAGRRNDSPDR